LCWQTVEQQSIPALAIASAVTGTHIRQDMKTHSIILTIFLTGLFPLITCGQTIDYYSFSANVAYLPSCGSQTEVYQKTDRRIKHSGTTISWKNCKRLFKSKLTPDPKILEQINYLDSLFRLDEFTITVNTAMIDSLKKWTSWKNEFNVTNLDIDNFFSAGNKVTLKLKEIKAGYNEAILLDGAPFSINLTIKRPDQDTIKYVFTGTLDGSILSEEIKYWLPMYLAYQKSKMFNSISLVNNYYSDEKFAGILIRFIAWTRK
jgi:hypothetical protein